MLCSRISSGARNYCERIRRKRTAQEEFCGIVVRVPPARALIHYGVVVFIIIFFSFSFFCLTLQSPLITPATGQFASVCSARWADTYIYIYILGFTLYYIYKRTFERSKHYTCNKNVQQRLIKSRRFIFHPSRARGLIPKRCRTNEYIQ